jgi:hypothetical protein
MNEFQATIESSIGEVDRLRSVLKKDKSIQVRSIDEKSIIKATALTWFNKHRNLLLKVINEPSLREIDSLYNDVLTLSDKLGSRAKFDSYLKGIKTAISTLRTQNITLLSASTQIINTNDAPPNFSTLVSDPDMVTILEGRWNECVICINAKAPLSATVMMGGLLESLLLTRFLQFPDKKLIFKTSTCPKEKATGTPLQFKEWVLRNYIDVAHELAWISQTEKDVGEVLRDYRNYIHPFKEKSHGIKLLPKDAIILWEVTKSIARQVINVTP